MRGPVLCRSSRLIAPSVFNSAECRPPCPRDRPAATPPERVKVPPAAAISARGLPVQPRNPCPVPSFPARAGCGSQAGRTEFHNAAGADLPLSPTPPPPAAATGRRDRDAGAAPGGSGSHRRAEKRAARAPRHRAPDGRGRAYWLGETHGREFPDELGLICDGWCPSPRIHFPERKDRAYIAKLRMKRWRRSNSLGEKRRPETRSSVRTLNPPRGNRQRLTTSGSTNAAWTAPICPLRWRNSSQQTRR